MMMAPAVIPSPSTVIPAKAGIQKSQAHSSVHSGKEPWIPAQAGIQGSCKGKRLAVFTHPRNPTLPPPSSAGASR